MSGRHTKIAFALVHQRWQWLNFIFLNVPPEVFLHDFGVGRHAQLDFPRRIVSSAWFHLIQPLSVFFYQQDPLLAQVLVRGGKVFVLQPVSEQLLQNAVAILLVVRGEFAGVSKPHVLTHFLIFSMDCHLQASILADDPLKHNCSTLRHKNILEVVVSVDSVDALLVASYQGVLALDRHFLSDGLLTVGRILNFTIAQLRFDKIWTPELVLLCHLLEYISCERTPDAKRLLHIMCTLVRHNLQHETDLVDHKIASEPDVSHGIRHFLLVIDAPQQIHAQHLDRCQHLED